MTKDEVAKLALEAYLQALEDTNKIIQEVMKNSIAFYKKAIEKHEENSKNE